jgi:ATP-dependent DNA ligase
VSFWDLMRGRGYLAFAAFDLLWLNGRDLRGLPLTQRKQRLERLIPATTGTLLKVPSLDAITTKKHSHDGGHRTSERTWIPVGGRDS